MPLSLLAYLLQGWYYVFSAGLYIEKKTRYFVHATAAGSIAAVAVTLLAVPSMGIVGAGWANVAGYGVMAAGLLWHAQRAYPIPFDWRRVGATCGLGAVLFAVWTFAPGAAWWPVEALLLVGFLGGLVALGIVPPAIWRRLLRRPHRAAAPSAEAPAESAETGAQMADLAGDPSEMASDQEGEPDASSPVPPAK